MMSEQDDWAAFAALMEREGWYQEFGSGSPFVHSSGAFYDPVDGTYSRHALAKVSNIGTWRDWLAAGTSPVPF